MVGGEQDTGESGGVGGDGRHLDRLVEPAVLMTDTRAKQELIHATQLLDEMFETFGRVVGRDVDRLDLDLPGILALELLKALFPSSGQSQRETESQINQGDLPADAGGGANKDYLF